MPCYANSIQFQLNGGTKSPIPFTAEM